MADSLFGGRIENSFSLSVTKWIHLNDGDAGIRAFFRRVNEVLRPGGSFVLEIQPSDSYHKARRMHPVRNHALVYSFAHCSRTIEIESSRAGA